MYIPTSGSLLDRAEQSRVPRDQPIVAAVATTLSQLGLLLGLNVDFDYFVFISAHTHTHKSDLVRAGLRFIALARFDS